MCSCNHQTANKDIDPSISSKLIRYDREILNLDSTNLTQDYQDLYAVYPIFTDLYLENIVGDFEDNNSKIEGLSYLIRDESFINLSGEIEDLYGDFSGIKPKSFRSFGMIYFSI